ncbi:MAG TPA: DNA double-strand break repair nuclease NurA [Anaerolineae bacterium]|nr:DNA double-strand break repair nuclease NurA [Anaerolineae bacterium]HIQ04443.1 DNA double-strand break repair nuclease NurA [Anaerolineae bacterium]
MTLELNKLTVQVEAMGRALATRRSEHARLAAQARELLEKHAQVTDELREKLKIAVQTDASWRGADPLGDRLDERHMSANPSRPATLVAADGSQIYLDPHGIAMYYLLNIGSIVLRQGTGEAPDTRTMPEVFFEESDLYDEAQRLVESDRVNAERNQREIKALADLATAERSALGGDISRPIITLLDGPLLLWPPQRAPDVEQRQRVEEFAIELDRLKAAQAIPLGYVDRPNSANMLRLLHLAELSESQINKDTLRASPYRSLADRVLFDDLAPGERTALFATTSEVNASYQRAGHRICFFYLNVSRIPGPEAARIARVEVPEWVARDPEKLDIAQAAVYADCVLTGYPYVLARAHELALVSQEERAAFEEMLRIQMVRQGLIPEMSRKAALKALTGGARRREWR